MSAGQKILDGLTQAVGYARGEKGGAIVREVKVPQSVDVKAIRQKLGLSQREFAMRFGFSLGCVRNWEQGHRGPDGSAKVLLTIIDKAPDVVDKVFKTG